MADTGPHERRVMMFVADLLADARPIIEMNLRGLTDEQYLWEPAADCWSVRRRSEIRSPDCWGRGDWVVETCLDGSIRPATTTIAWRLMHAYDCVSDFTSRAFGGGGADWNEIDVPPVATVAVDLMMGALDRLQEAVATSQDAVLSGDVDPLFQMPRSRLLGKALHEALHHCAEIGVLRSMFTTLQPR